MAKNKNKPKSQTNDTKKSALTSKVLTDPGETILGKIIVYILVFGFLATIIISAIVVVIQAFS